MCIQGQLDAFYWSLGVRFHAINILRMFQIRCLKVRSEFLQQMQVFGCLHAV